VSRFDHLLDAPALLRPDEPDDEKSPYKGDVESGCCASPGALPDAAASVLTASLRANGTIVPARGVGAPPSLTAPRCESSES
jgi:hypothetical protein